jgi:hypothetical protein
MSQWKLICHLFTALVSGLGRKAEMCRRDARMAEAAKVLARLHQVRFAMLISFVRPVHLLGEVTILTRGSNRTTSSKLTAYTRLSHGAKTCVLFTPQLRLRVKSLTTTSLTIETVKYPPLCRIYENMHARPSRGAGRDVFGLFSTMSWKHHTTKHQSLHHMIRT